MKSLVTGIALFVSSVSVAAQVPTLASVAEKAAKSLPRGCIVTGEWSAGKPTFAVSGPDQPPNVPPEKIVFEIGSITKTFTGLLLAQAVMEKKLSFETTLAEVFNLKKPFDDEKVAAITLGQVASHTSGLPRMPDNADFRGADPYATYDLKKLSQWIVGVKLEKAPPHEISYSNVGIALLGHAIEQALGDSWVNLVRQRICEPLGMHDTMPVPTEELRRRLVPPFEGKKEAHEWTFQAFAPAGALRSTAADLMLFGRAILQPESSPLKDAITLALKPLREGIGCCFFLDETNVSHGGGTGGYRTHLQVSPRSGQIDIVLINNADTEPGSLIQKRYAKPFAAKEGTKLSAAELQPFLGVFELTKNAKFTFLLRNGGLWGRLTGQPFLPLTHEAGDSFFYRPVAARFLFQRDAAKAVTAIVLDQNGRKQTAKRVSDPLPAYLFRPAKELKEYTGTYDLLPPLQVFTLEVRAATLYVQLTGQPSMPVFETKKDYFEYATVPAAIGFERDDTGRITRLHLHQNGLKLPASKREE